MIKARINAVLAFAAFASKIKAMPIAYKVASTRPVRRSPGLYGWSGCENSVEMKGFSVLRKSQRSRFQSCDQTTHPSKRRSTKGSLMRVVSSAASFARAAAFPSSFFLLAALSLSDSFRPGLPAAAASAGAWARSSLKV